MNYSVHLVFLGEGRGDSVEKSVVSVDSDGVHAFGSA